jgi:hypothetical protein
MSRKDKGVAQALDIFRSRNKVGDHILDLRPTARRFVFDREASTHLGHFIRDCGGLIIANRQFAIPPFPVTYLQVELDEVIAGIGKGSTVDIMGAENRDTQVGYLIDGRRVYPIPKSNKGTAAMGLFYYEMDTPAGPGPIFDEPVQIGDRDDEWARAVLLLGTTIHDLPDEDSRLDVIRSVRIRLDPRYEISKMELRRGQAGGDARVTLIDQSIRISRMQKRMVVTASAGDARIVWAALLLLNQRRGNVSFREVPWQASIYKGKRVVFSSHSVVTIHLKDKQTIAGAMRPGLHMPKAAHDVKGHFAHFNLKDGCTHDWPSMPDVSDDGIARWHCLHCGGRRTWKKAYTTGNAAVGFTTKEYEVKP